MVQHQPPSAREFLQLGAREWLTSMSGWLSVPFAVLAFIFPTVRWFFAVLAACAFAPTFYRIWAQERRSLSEVEAHLAPRLRIEFDPLQPKFLSSTPTLGGVEMLYVRVLARAVSPTVKNCRAYLQRVSQLDGGRYVMLFDVPLPLPWSYENPRSVQPKQLNHDVDTFLDVAWFGDPNSGFVPFGLLNVDTSLPIRLQEILENQILPSPTRNLQLDLLITGDDSENATLSLNIHRGNPQWNQPQIGWMDSIGMIRRESNISPE
jgi:hypothetical protein